MTEINNGANCGGCDFYLHMEDADYADGDPIHAISPAHGECKRFPHWERKAPTTPACGEHPQYFEPTVNPDELRSEWINTKTGERITHISELDDAVREGVAHCPRPGEVVPIDGPIKS